MGNCGGSEKPPRESRAMRMHKERIQEEKEEREQLGSMHGSFRAERPGTLRPTTRRRSSYGGGSLRAGGYDGGASMTSMGSRASFRRDRRSSRSAGAGVGADRNSVAGVETESVHIQDDDPAHAAHSPGARSMVSSYGGQDERSPMSNAHSVNGADRSPASLRSSMRSPMVKPQSADRRESFASCHDNASDDEMMDTVKGSTVRFEIADDEQSTRDEPNNRMSGSPRVSPKASPQSPSTKPAMRRPVSPLAPSGRVSPVYPPSGRTSPMAGGASLTEISRQSRQYNEEHGLNGSFRRSGSFEATGSMKGRKLSTNSASSMRSRRPSTTRRSSRVNL